MKKSILVFASAMMLMKLYAAELPPYLMPFTEKNKRADVITVAEIPGGPLANPAAAKQVRSLDGMWKCGGVISARNAFPVNVDLDKGYADPEFNDSGWDEIKVPAKFYSKFPKLLNSDSPYLKGNYRYSFELTAAELQNRRVILNFEAVGYESIVFLNGKEIGRHHGFFTPFELDATGIARPGKNVLALRVLSDFGRSGNIAKLEHVYGGGWTLSHFPFGIWRPVFLSLEPEIRIKKLFVNPELGNDSVMVECVVVNTTGKTVTGTLTARVTPAIRNDAAKLTGCLANQKIELPPGEKRITFSIPLKNPEKWSFSHPYLYFAAIEITDGNKVVSSDAVRFGYRNFHVKDGKFYLNGEETYLFANYINAAAQSNISDIIQLKKQNYNIARTVHQLVSTDILNFADEIGFMIFHEWGWSFCDDLNIKAFEENNMAELREFVEMSYNHPSVVMWSLGNEVSHRDKPEIARLLNMQTQLVHQWDKQQRPVSVFSGAAVWNSYGEAKLDTDIFDRHCYIGMSRPWTELPDQLNMQYAGLRRIYGEKEFQANPMTTWESVGFSWGIFADPKFRRGNVGDYAEYMGKPTSWATPNGIGFTGCAPLSKVLSPGFATWAQGYYGHRIFEILRLDERHAGFAPWFNTHPLAALWTQPVIVSLHSENYLFPRNLFSGEKSDWLLEIVNSSADSWRNVQLEITVFSPDNTNTKLNTVGIGAVGAFQRLKQTYTLKMPELPRGRHQLRLTLKSDGKDIARNFYDLFIAGQDFPSLTPSRPIFILDTAAGNVKACEKLLARYGIKPQLIKSPAELKDAGVLIIPAECVEPQKVQLTDSAELTNFIRNYGGVLLVLEQRNSQSRLPGKLAVSAENNTFVDLVIPDHPIFAGLDYNEFDTWNNSDHGYIVKNTYMPYITNALAIKGPRVSNSNVGNAIIEGTDGKGRIICSQLETSACYEQDSAARVYLNNLISYATGNQFWQNALPLADADAQDYAIAEIRITPIDLASYANTSFSDEKAGDHQGGWNDQGENDFRNMPLGRYTAGGVPFEIIAPARNNGKSCLVLRGSQRPYFAAAINGIEIDKKVSRLFFLHTAAWAYTGGSPGGYRINYADGAHTIYKLECGKNIGDWWSVAQLSDAKIGIVRKNALGHQVGCYVSCWENPRPDVEVKSLDFLSATEVRGSEIDWLPTDAPVPLLIAVTAETRSDAAVNLLGKSYLHAMGLAKPATTDGGRCVNIAFPARNADTKPSNGVIRFKKENLGNDYTTLSCWIKSDRSAVLRFQLPEENWRGRYHGEIAVKGDGQFHQYRLFFDRDLIAAPPVSFKTLRGELFISNESARSANAAYPAMNITVRDICLE